MAGARGRFRRRAGQELSNQVKGGRHEQSFGQSRSDHGATSGIGRAAAKLFVERGAAVVLGGRRREEGEALAAELRARGGRAVFGATDVTKRADNEALVALALSSFGKLDVAYHNAGVEAVGPLVEFDDAAYDKVFDTNVRGVFSSLRAQIPALTKTRGSIILTSSTAGSRGFARPPSTRRASTPSKAS